MINKITIIGGDLRLVKLSEMLINEGAQVFTYGLEEAINNSEIVIGPIPFSSNGETINAPFSKEKIQIEEIMELLKGKILVAGSIKADLYELASKNDRIVAVTAAMKDGTGLKEFANKFPNRFFDVGIAEQHAVGMIAGMAASGLKPVFAVYSSFLQRGYDQLIHDVALENIPVTICIDRAGIVGADGETHQGIFDLCFLNSIPNLIVIAPKDFKELEHMLEFAINLNKPVIIRYPRGGEGTEKFEQHNDIELGESEIIKEGKDLSIIAIGKMVERAQEIANLLEKENINAEVINARFLKPLDKETILKSVEKTKNAVTIEDGLIEGGLRNSCYRNN